ncbi:MAG TPA: nuclear transport factor 2 family protein [Steroidobacteraceae bacterium]|nr:nuclear transport factor 2 family protein [Steroidobacteraceae bacterium]
MVHSESTRVSAEDRAEIIETYARYAWGLDLADADMLLSAFAEDAEFDHLWQGKVRGHAAILANMRELWNDRQHWWFGRQHLFNHYIMERQPDASVKVRCFFQIMQFNVDYGTNFVFGIGTREDLCVQRGGRWVFKTLFINAWRSQADVPWKGEIKLVGRPSGPGAAKPSLPPSFTTG